MFGLANQIAGHTERIGHVVGQDRNLGRTGQLVEADLAECLTLGFGNVLVTRADDHVDRCEVWQRDVGHDRQSLHAI